MTSLSSTSRVLAALRSAGEVTFSAYTLGRGSLMERALERAAKRGAQVHVRLDGYGEGHAGIVACNRAAAAALREAGVDAQIVHTSDHDGPELHLKAAVCDGVAYLDDCNWKRHGDTVLRDDTPADVRAIRRAVLARDGAGAHDVALTKNDALRDEARTLRSCANCRVVDVETEELGGSAVSSALRKLHAQGVRCRVLVSSKAMKSPVTCAAAFSLQKAGIEVRRVDSSEKLAIAGSHVWTGSANATSPYFNGNAIEWSLAGNDAHLERALRARFNAHWRESKPL